MSRSYRQAYQNTSQSRVELWLENYYVPSSSFCETSSSPVYNNSQHQPREGNNGGHFSGEKLTTAATAGGGNYFFKEDETGEEDIIMEDEEFSAGEEDLGENCEEEELCTAEDLVDVLKSCRVCFESKDSPLDTIWCIVNHRKYLCLFCFRIVDENELVTHTKSERSSKRCIEGNAVKCPYSKCSQMFFKQRDLLQDVHQLFENLYFHVAKVHLPQAYDRDEVEGNNEEAETERYESGRDGNGDRRISRETYDDDVLEDEPDNRGSECGKEVASVIDKFVGGNDVKIQEVYKRLNGCDDSDMEKIPLEDLVFAATGLSKNLRKRKLNEDFEDKAFEDDDDDVVLLCETKGIVAVASVGVGRAFVCGFCNTAFPLRRRLHDHYEKKSCKKLKNKTCHRCQTSFRGYTVVDVVNHLISCAQCDESEPSLTEETPELEEQFEM